jgi:hypothetical protein
VHKDLKDLKVLHPETKEALDNNEVCAAPVSLCSCLLALRLKHHAAISALEAEIQKIQRLLPDEEEDLLHKLHDLVDGYRGVFLDVVAAYRQRGFQEWA